jgi:hypothetical protein
VKIGRVKRTILAGVGAITLGAIGSGLWDVIVKPSGHWAGNAILTASTLGSARVKDQMYLEAAKGYREGASLATLEMLTSVLIVSPFPFIFWTIKARTEFRRAISSAAARDTERNSARSENAMPSSVNKYRFLRKRIERKFMILYGLIVLLFIFIGADFISILKVAQANRAYGFFSQSMSICRPYIDERQAQILASRYAGVRSRADYLKITDELRQIASSNHLLLPDYKPW